MRPNKKAIRDLEKLKAMLVKSGIATKEIVEQAADIAPTGREAVSRQGDAILLFLEKPAAFTTKQCSRVECGEWFGTNYRSVGYCSDNCRGREISRQTGLKWDYRKDEFARWGGEPPLVIDPTSLKKLKQYVIALEQHVQIQIEISESLPQLPQLQQELLIPVEEQQHKQDNSLTTPLLPLVPLVSPYKVRAAGYPFDF